jgi:hypothetical protein
VGRHKAKLFQYFLRGFLMYFYVVFNNGLIFAGGFNILEKKSPKMTLFLKNPSKSAAFGSPQCSIRRWDLYFL